MDAERQQKGLNDLEKVQVNAAVKNNFVPRYKLTNTETFVGNEGAALSDLLLDESGIIDRGRRQVVEKAACKRFKRQVTQHRNTMEHNVKDVIITTGETSLQVQQ
jgi:hypothetical protein